MLKRKLKDPETRQWRMLLVYDVYRIMSIFLFLGMYYFSLISNPHAIFFYSTLVIYFMLSIFFLYLWKGSVLAITSQVFISGIVDVLALSIMLTIIGNLQSGYGILLNVTIAALSILAPGRLAIFFAALASCSLLTGSFILFILNNQKDLATFYYSGIYGAGFFATALTAWYLSNRVRVSEDLARHRSYELAGMQKINEYIVERLHSGIIYVDEQKNIKLINSAARAYFNVTSKIDATHLDQLSPILSIQFEAFLNKIKKKERIAPSIIEDPYLKVHFFATAVANNPAVLIILEDMTYIAQQAQQLKLASLGRFSAGIAHELRNPLGAISHAVQLLGDDKKLNKEDERLKQLIINNCERMNGVIKNVLQLSRRNQAEPQVQEIIPFLEQFKQNFSLTNNCTIHIKGDRKKGISVVFDKSQLEQVLVILCDNAMSHGKDKDGNVFIDITVKAFEDKTVISVCDRGPGITEDIEKDIFEPFFTTLRNGTGMGLFLARDLCEINQARLNLVRSTQGSCFAITISTVDELLI